MSEQCKIAFEKIEKSFCDWFDPNDGQNYQDCWYAAWSAATTESNKRIEELESELAKFGELRQLYKDKWIVYKPEYAPYAGIRTEDGVTIAGTSSGLSEKDAQEICANRVDADSLYAMVGMLANERKKSTQLQASNNDLRNILLEIRDRFFPANQPESDKDLMWDDVNNAIDATPAESLQAFENEVLERAAKVCEEMTRFVAFQSKDCYSLANESSKTIRNLKSNANE